MIPINNQPVFFGESDECSDDIEFAQLVDIADKTQFQLELDACFSAPNLITNNQFSGDTDWSLGANWAIADNQLCHSSGSDEYVISDITFVDESYYKVIIIVNSIDFGSQFLVKLGTTELGTISTTGTFTYFGYFDYNIKERGLSITPVNDGDLCISEIDAFKVLLDEIIQIKDLDGNVQATITYNDQPEYFNITDNAMTVTIDWQELEVTQGCYVICIADACENTNGQNYPPTILNGDFESGSDNWTSDGEVTYNSGYVTLGNGTDEFVLTQNNVFKSFTNEYCITLDVSNFDGDEVNVYFGFNLVGTIITADNNTTKTITGYCTGSFDLRFSNSGAVQLDITNIISCPIESYTCNYTSNIFKLADYSNSCTLLINACNNENGLGFVFNGSGFTPRIRLYAKLKTPKYISERNIFEDSLGKKGVVYYSGRKAKQLCIDAQPEYVHDFLRLLNGFDNVYIDGKLYFVEDDEYSFEPIESYDNIGKVRILVSEKVQNVKNVNCSDSESVCILQEDFLIQTNGDYVLQTDGSKIIING